MGYDPEKHHRKTIRLKGYDYSQPGFYYVTICTQDRIERFGDVEHDKMILHNAGKMVDAEWNRIPERYEHVIIDEYQMMPNHFHGILQITSPANGVRQTIDPGIVGTGFMPVLIDDDKTNGDGVDDNDNIIVNGHNDCVESIENKLEKVITASERRGNVITASGRMGIKHIPTGQLMKPNRET